MSVFEFEVCFLYAAEGWILSSYPICYLCLFIGGLRPLTLREIKVNLVFIFVFDLLLGVLLYVDLPCLLFCVFVEWDYLLPVICKCNSLRLEFSFQ